MNDELEEAMLLKFARPCRQHLSAARRCLSHIEAPLLLQPQQAAALSDPKPVFLDATWFMPNSERKAQAEFEQKRIHGTAGFFDLDAVASPNELGLKHMIPSAEQFKTFAESFGIQNDTHVIVYDTHGVFSSPRALFTLRAFGHANSSVLDGGLPHWQASGLPIDTTPFRAGSSKSTPYELPVLNKDVIKSYSQVVDNATRSSAGDTTADIVLDARSAGRFSGKDPEPRPGISSGHIPQSHSLPFNLFLNTNEAAGQAPFTTLKTPAEIARVLAQAVGEQNAIDIINGDRSVMSTCGSGMTAAIIWLALKSLGVDKLSLYDESWTGYASRSSSIINKLQ